MRDLIVFGIVVLMLPTAFRKPFVGLCLFSWLAYMRPQDLCWGFARTIRFSFFVGVTMVVGWYVNESHRRRFFKPEIRSYLLVILALLISIGLLFASRNGPTTANYYFEFLKIIIVALFTISQVDTKQRARALMWVIAGSLAFYSVKNGLGGILRGGAVILNGPGGMLEDNNDFALALVMALPLLFYLGREEENPLLRKGSLIAIGMTMVTVLLLHSRGGFLAMATSVLWMTFRTGRIIQAGIVLVFLVGAFFTLAPDHVLERIFSISEGEQDASIASRFESWAAGWRMFLDHPVWGVGLRNFLEHSADYGVSDGPGGRHVAHNSYIQILAEGGAFAFITYMSLLGSVFVSTSWLRRVGKMRPDLKWARSFGSMFEAITLSFMVGSTFLNRGHFDLIYHYLAIVGALVLIVRKELAAGPKVETSESHLPGAQAVTVRWRSPQADTELPRWERIT